MKVGVVGANGYTGSEVVRWLLGHPDVEIAAVVSRSHAGERLADVVPSLEGFTDLVCEDFDPDRLSALDAVFLATAHGAARELAPALRASPLVIDLSMDHRLEWTYGLVEWNEARIAESDRIAVPGCFATAIALALAPLVPHANGPITVAAATGSTGSGSTPQAATHHAERFANLRAYKVLVHQHLAELTAFLGTAIHFVPLSAPIDRGILATCFVPTHLDARAAVETAYRDRPLIRLRADSPELRHVRGTAFADLAVHQDDEVAVVLCAIDNLGKGAASQAVSCLNLRHGLPVDRGLRVPPSTP